VQLLRKSAMAYESKLAPEPRRPAQPNPSTVADIPDEKLIERAVRNARHKRGEPKWAAISNTFGLGSTFSYQLCRRFGIDPEEVKPMRRRRGDD
jgi:hypothetical protein